MCWSNQFEVWEQKFWAAFWQHCVHAPPKQGRYFRQPRDFLNQAPKEISRVEGISQYLPPFGGLESIDLLKSICPCWCWENAHSLLISREVTEILQGFTFKSFQRAGWVKTNLSNSYCVWGSCKIWCNFEKWEPWRRSGCCHLENMPVDDWPSWVFYHLCPVLLLQLLPVVPQCHLTSILLLEKPCSLVRWSRFLHHLTRTHTCEHARWILGHTAEGREGRSQRVPKGLKLNF